MIIYFHGFASSGASYKSAMLATVFGADNVYAPDFPYDCDEIEDMVARAVFRAVQDQKFPIVFCGTSLGGFYAAYFAAKYSALGVLINPSTAAPESMESKIGMHTNFVTKEPFEVTEKFVNDLYKWDLGKPNNGALEVENRNMSIFVAKDDNVVSYRITALDFPMVRHFIVKEDGGHRFEKHWPEVMAHIKELHK